MARPVYPPMSQRHKLVFVSAFLAFVLLGVGAAFARLRLIGWWLESCDEPNRGCGLAAWAVDWWWLVFLPLSLGLAYAAHRATRSRLDLPGDGSA